jgi:tetratricopeptide (TPR) repeat protein
MLETVREYAAERLERSGDGERVRQSHAHYFLTLAKRLRQDEPPDFYERLSIEHDNVRAALSWAHETNQGEMLLRLANSLGPYWAVLGHNDEARRWGQLAIDADAGLPLEHAIAQAELGYCLLRTGDHVQARDLLTAALTQFRTCGYTAGIGHVLLSLSAVAALDGDREYATELAEQAARFAHERDDPTLGFWAGVDLARLALGHGDRETARARLREAANAEQVRRDSPSFVWLVERAFLALHESDEVGALSLFRESIARQQQAKLFVLLPDCLTGLALIATAQAQEEHAARLLGAADRLRDLTGPAPRPQTTNLLKEAVERAGESLRAALGHERFTAAQAQGQAMDLDDAIAYANNILFGALSNRPRSDEPPPQTASDAIPPVKVETRRQRSTVPADGNV